MKLNYDLIPEELKRAAIDAHVRLAKRYSSNGLPPIYSQESLEIGKGILATQQTKKPVDMEPLVNYGVLCEFSDFEFEGDQYFGMLQEVKINGTFYGYRRPWLYCRPLYGHWHSAKNFDDVKCLIKRLTEAGFEVEEIKDAFETVVHFRITGLQDGYCEPWEMSDE